MFGDMQKEILTQSIFEKILYGLMIVTIALTLHFMLRALIKKIMTTTGHKMSERKTNTLRTVIMSISKYTIIFFATGKMLQLFGVMPESVLAVAGIGSVAIGFGAQSLVKDIITGLFILMEDQFGVGDVITVENRTGTVEAMGLRAIHIRSMDGSLHIIPNGEIKIVTNISNSFHRAIIDVLIPYGEDLSKALPMLETEMEMAYKVVKGLKTRPIVLGITALTDNGVNIRILADCNPGEHWCVEQELRGMIKARLEKDTMRFLCPRNIIKVQKMPGEALGANEMAVFSNDTGVERR